MKQLTTMLFVFVLIGVQAAYSQNIHKIYRHNHLHHMCICHASEDTQKSFIPPPEEFLLKSGEKKSEIIVNYSLFPPQAIDAFEYAVEIWEHIIESEIPIYIQANWRTQSKNVLGSAGPTDFKTDFEFIPHEGRYYPIAVAEKISRKNINTSNAADIRATFNKTVNWYFGTDGETPSEMYDFVSVVLHEIGHGLGFTGFYYVTNEGLGTSFYKKRGDAASFDLLVTNFDDEFITDTSVFENPSDDLRLALQAGILFADSPVAKSRNNGGKPKLFAPNPFDDGSSIYHLNDLNYKAGTENSLMTHSLSKGEAIHDPGPLVKGILDDIGWSNVYIKFDKLKDIEDSRPINFTASITSDYLLDTTSLYAIYSLDNFENHIDSLPLLYTDSGYIFEGTLTPHDTTKFINYYIQAGDTTNRTFYFPTQAPEKFFTIAIAPDTKLPEIQHTPISFFLLNEDSLEVQVNADDNVGVDTVFVEYSINGVQQVPFGLSLDSMDSYSALFNFDKNLLKDGDLISYRIVARDSSKAKNSAIFPSDTEITFYIEEIFDPVESYYTNFNNISRDFLLNDFDIYQETGFEDPALHSFHPYPSPNDNDLHFDLTTFLKYPIIIAEGGTMSFDEIVLVEPGERSVRYPNQDFYDYVVVEGSKDMGKTWQDLAPGYDSTDKELWETVYNENINDDNLSTNTGNPDLFITREINLLENGNFSAGDTILIQFRLYSDPYAKGWGWAIDNLRIQQAVSADNIHAGKNISVYPNPFNNKLNVLGKTNGMADIKIDIFNLFGQKMNSVELKNINGRFNESINLNELSIGIYIVAVQENGKVILNKKVIKKD